MMKKWRYLAEAVGALLLYGLLKLLPVGWASALGGWVGRQIGPRTRVHQIAQFNLHKAFPDMPLPEQTRLLDRMWDNLGRVFAEYPHLTSRAMKARVTDIRGLEHLRAVHDSPQAAVVVSGHLGNWEMGPVMAAEKGVKFHLLYRPANNPMVEKLIAMVRSPYTLGLHGKGYRSAKAIIQAIRKQEPVGLLFDQKANDGVPVALFGMEAMTSDVVAQIVMKHQARIIPTRCIRQRDGTLHMEVEPAMLFDLSGDFEQDRDAIMRQLHDMLERWIREDPSQWFWVHKRWPHSRHVRQDQEA